MHQFATFAMTSFFALTCSVANAQNAATPGDAAQIDQLLGNYTASVSSGNRAQFEAQLLDLDIPFSAIGNNTPDPKQPMGLRAVQDYKGFRKVIFESGKRYRQRFSNIKIEQVGNLAQVSLDYETTLAGEDYAGKGWKVMQLIKYAGQWKIASEFFTGYPAP